MSAAFLEDSASVLVFAPHPDDELLGCGGLLHPGSRFGKRVVFATSMSERDKSACKAACAEYGATFRILFPGFDGALEQVPTAALTERIEREIDSSRPDVLLFSEDSHHPDHHKLFKCVLGALRQRGGGHQPNVVAAYSYPLNEVFFPAQGGGPIYKMVSEEVAEWKARMLANVYGYKMRERPSPLNRDGVLAWSRAMGVESGCFEYAEKMRLLIWRSA